jgi:uncharacterized membrane protein
MVDQASADGQPHDIAWAQLGDRVQINSVSIQDGEIAVDMVTHGPDDPMCCPTQQVVQTYALQGEELVLMTEQSDCTSIKNRNKGEGSMAKNIVVLGFKNQYGAEALLNNVQKWQEEGLIELEDAVIASRGPGGDVQIEQTHKQGGRFALRGGGAGLLAGLLLGGPVLGLVAGAAAGGIAGSLKDYGLDDNFVKEVSQWVRPETSALFLLVKEAKVDTLLEKLRPFEAVVLTTTLASEQEQRLRNSLAEEEYN